MKKKCLIIEDSLFIRELYRICLKDVNVEIIGEVADGAAGIKQVIELSPDIVLLDLVLPEKSGFDVLSECSHLRSKFVVISSLPKTDYEQKAKALGALFYLEKPFKKQQFVDAVETALHRLIEAQHG